MLTIGIEVLTVLIVVAIVGLAGRAFGAHDQR
jgi:hypothetical protein